MKVAFWMLAACALHAQTLSEWAFGGPDHRLHYRNDSPRKQHHGFLRGRDIVGAV